MFLFFPGFFKKNFHNTVMFYNIPTIAVVIQQKARKKKRTVLMLIYSTVSQKSWN